jgi:hypothetical protein
VSTATEVWRPTHVRGDRYEVSNLGRVRSTWAGGRILRPRRSVREADDHLTVQIYWDGKQHNVYVHQLVARAFVPGSGDLVRHLNGDGADNRAENLAWGDKASNMRDTLRHGRHRGLNKTHCVHGHSLADAYVYQRDGHIERVCRTCNRERTAHSKAKKGMAA